MVFCTDALSSVANVFMMMVLAPAHAASKRSTPASTAATVAKGFHVHEQSTSVDRMRSHVSGSVVYSSRTKPWNAEPVLLSTVSPWMLLVRAMPPAREMVASTLRVSWPSRKKLCGCGAPSTSMRVHRCTTTLMCAVVMCG